MGKHQRPHFRVRNGKRFPAGRGKNWSPGITSGQIHSSTKLKIPTLRVPTIPVRAIRPSTALNKVKNIGQQVSWNAFLNGVFLTASFGTGQPWIYAAFRAYKTGDFAYKMARKLEEQQTDKSIEELAKKGLGFEIRGISDPKIKEVSDNLLYAFCDTGLANMIVKETALNRNIVDTVFHGTVTDILHSGIENLANFAVDMI